MLTLKTILASTTSFVLLFGSTLTFAEQVSSNCAVISTKKAPQHRDKAPLILTSHNGKHLYGITKKLAIPERSARGSSQTPFGSLKKREPKRSYKKLVLEPGVHHFTAYVERKRSQPAGTEFSFAINVEAGTFYKLIGQRAYPKVSNPRKEFEPIILTTKVTDCDQDNFKKVYRSVAGNATAKTKQWSPIFAVNMDLAGQE